VQKYQAGRGLAFHFDKDEVAMKEKGEMLQPKFSSIFYLTGDTRRPRQGMSKRCLKASITAMLTDFGMLV
jgi:hypothetical protein